MKPAAFYSLAILISMLASTPASRAQFVNQSRGIISSAPQRRAQLEQGNTTKTLNATAAPTKESPQTSGLKFAPVVLYGSGGYSPSLSGGAVVAVADVNGDGKPDIVAANECIDSVDCNNGVLGVLLGNGDGTFKTAVSYGSGGYYAESVAVADVNGDGKPDIVVANQCNDSINCNNGLVDVLLGNGDGSFQTAVAYGSGGYYADWLAVADVNGDGKPDIVVLNECIDSIDCSKETVGILLGNGDGTFQTVVTYGFGGSGGDHGENAAVADVNGDGKPDIVVANPDDLAVLLGNGDGTFQTAVAYGSGGRYPSLAGVADVNGDGKPDIVAVNVCSTPVQCTEGAMGVLLGNGDGTFQTPAAYGSGGLYPFSAAVADLDGDGKPDIVVANDDGAVNVLLGNGDGTFQSAVNYGTNEYSFAVADVNGDGKPDLLAMAGIGGSVAVFINIGGAATTITLVSSLNPSNFGQAVTFTTTVTSQDSQHQSTPTGTVSYFDGTSKLGDSSLDNSGTSSLAVSTLAPGPHSITATYSGDKEFAQNTSSLLSQFVQGGQPAAEVTPASLMFTPQPLGVTSSVQNLTLTNTAYIAVNISSIGITGANSSEFAQSNNCGTSVPISGSCSISVTFTPAALGNAVASLNVTDDAGNSPQSVTLSGTGTPPTELTPTIVDFGGQSVGITSVPQNVTLTNASNTAVSISSIGITGADSRDFAQSNNCGTSVPANGVCSISVTFTPAALGSAVASLNVTDNSPGSPLSVSLSGTGLGASVGLSTPSMSFSSQYVGTSGLPQTLIVTNTGNESLTITTVTSSAADFGPSSNCTNPVEPGRNCTIAVFFDPTVSGTRTGALLIHDNGVGNPHSVSLSGTGQDFSLAPSGSSTSTITAGQSTNYTIAVNPAGGFNQIVGLSCSGAPAQSTCSLSSSSVKLDGAMAASVTLSVTTAGTSASLAPRAGFPFGSSKLALWFALSGVLGLTAMGILGVSSRMSQKTLLYAVAFLCVFSLGITWSACGGGTSNGGGGGGGTPAGTYNLTVTGTFTSGSTTLNHATKLILVVQ